MKRKRKNYTAQEKVALLKRLGLITHARRRRPLGHPGRPTTAMTEPNAVWTTDFKGQFPTQDGVLCYPLTVADGASRSQRRNPLAKSLGEREPRARRGIHRLR